MGERIIVFGGDGILPPVVDLDERERRSEAESAEVLKREAREVAAAVHDEKVNGALGEIEAELIKVVRAELAEEIAARKTPPKTLASYKKHIAAFRAWCESYPVPLPHRPAAPQAVAGFLAHMATSGATLSEAKRAAEAISYPSRLADLSDPSRDVLVGAVLRYLTKTISPTAKPSQPK